MIEVVMSNGQSVHFQNASMEINKIGMLSIFCDGVNVAVFADGAWSAVLQPLTEDADEE